MKKVENWIGRPTQSQVGVKGFQSVDTENKKDARQIFMLSKRQLKIVDQFSKEIKMSKSDLFRIALFEYLTNHNIDTEGQAIIDENQLNLFDK